MLRLRLFCFVAEGRGFWAVTGFFLGRDRVFDYDELEKARITTSRTRVVAIGGYALASELNPGHQRGEDGQDPG